MVSLRDQVEAHTYESRRQVARLLGAAHTGRPVTPDAVRRGLAIGVAVGFALMGVVVLIGYLGGRT